jgi:hypothetical protein
MNTVNAMDEKTQETIREMSLKVARLKCEESGESESSGEN